MGGAKLERVEQSLSGLSRCGQNSVESSLIFGVDVTVYFFIFVGILFLN